MEIEVENLKLEIRALSVGWLGALCTNKLKLKLKMEIEVENLKLKIGALSVGLVGALCTKKSN